MSAVLYLAYFTVLLLKHCRGGGTNSYYSCFVFSNEFLKLKCIISSSLVSKDLYIISPEDKHVLDPTLPVSLCYSAG